MTEGKQTGIATHVFRVDKFIVPVAAREEFVDKVRATHRILREQPGFIRDLILEQTSGPGRFNLVTLVEWESQSVMEGVKAIVMAEHAKTGFNAQELMKRLGIEADIANYAQILD